MIPPKKNNRKNDLILWCIIFADNREESRNVPPEFINMRKLIN